MDLGVFWTIPRGVSPRPEWGHARVHSSRAVAAVSRFPSRGSRDLWLCLEAFPRGFPTRLSHVPPWCESILGLKVEAVQGKQVSMQRTETSGGLWEWWHDPGFPLAFPVENASCSDARECQESFPDDTGRESILSSYEAETGLLWMWAGLSCFLSSEDGYVGELLELQQGCEVPFGSSRG